MVDTEPQTKPTASVPAERSSEWEIAEQARYFLASPHFARLYDAVPDIVMILNRNRQAVFANAALLDLLGMRRESFVGGQRPGEVLGCVHISDGEKECGTTEFCTTCGAVQAIMGGLGGRITARECRISRDDGDALDLYVWASPLHENGGDYSIVVIKDISNEKRRQALERVFFHDVMNIVNNILISADLLKESALQDDAEELKEGLSQLSQHLAWEIIAQRDLAAAENNELIVHPSSFSTRAVITEVVKMYEFYNYSAGKVIVISPEAADVTITSDKTLLQRVLGNLVKNALEASSAGDTVTIDCADLGGRVAFTVHNPAVMPNHVRLQVFERSFSTKGVGRGLGTFSVRLLTERYLGGGASFTSTKKDGTTFRVEYPIALG